jgi:hypothetical protein
MLPHKLYFYKGSYSFITMTEKIGKGVGKVDVECWMLDVGWEEWEVG